jgi:hypothetical protein
VPKNFSYYVCRVPDNIYISGMGYLQNIFAQNSVHFKTVKFRAVVIWVRVLACIVIDGCDPDCGVVSRSCTFNCIRPRANISSQFQKWADILISLRDIKKDPERNVCCQIASYFGSSV